MEKNRGAEVLVARFTRSVEKILVGLNVIDV